MKKIYNNAHNQTVTDFFNEAYEERETMCPPQEYMFEHGRKSTFFHKYNKRCKVSEILSDEISVKISSVPTERTETPEEALALSIWSPHNTFDLSILRLFLIK